MDYEKTIDTGDNSRKLMASIQSLLERERFKTVEDSGDTVKLRRPLGSVNNRTPFCGVSLVEITSLGRQAQVRADFGHVRWARNFLLVFLPMLALILTAVFWGKKADRGTTEIWQISLITLGPWILIGPVMMRSFRRKSRREMDDLIQTAASVAKAGNG